MIDQILREGFIVTHRRVGLIFLDIFWKALWFLLTGALVAVFVGWIGAELQSAVVNAPGFGSRNPILALTLIRQFWSAYGTDVFWGAAVITAFSGILWFLLEAYFRSGLLPAVNATFGENVANHFKVFLMSSIVRTLVVLGAGVLLGVFAFWPYLTSPRSEWPELWSQTRGVALIDATILLMLLYMLTIADTLIRSDAVKLLATHLLEIAGLIGILLLFEVCLAATAVISILTGLVSIATPTEALFMIVVSGLALFFMSAVHSYLLLVRFFSIGIMKRNGIEV